MPVAAGANLPIASASYLPALTFGIPFGGGKLTLFIINGALFGQVIEDRSGAWEAPSNTEFYLRPGAHSILFAVPIYGFRVRSESPVPALIPTIDWRAT